MSPTPIGFLKLTVHGGSNLASQDTNGLSDPYVQFSLKYHSVEMLSKRKTDISIPTQGAKETVVKYKTLDPTWEQSYNLEVYDPTAFLCFDVFDRDRFSADDWLGELEVQVGHLMQPGQAHNEIKKKSYQLSSNSNISKLYVTGDLTLSFSYRAYQFVAVELAVEKCTGSEAKKMAGQVIVKDSHRNITPLTLPSEKCVTAHGHCT
ncbi:hypothetical protein CYMTET_21192, partial [Cymbomonas tetramitiformis]